MDAPPPFSPPFPPPPPRDQRKINADHLNLLAIFHFVGAGLAVLAMLFLFAHYEFMHFFFANPKFWADQKQTPPPVEFFQIFIWFYIIGGIWLLTSCILNLISGRCLLARKHRTFSMVVAGFNCLHMPLGTALGIFSLIVLMRDSVRELYDS
jgi:hypothetical protein